MTVMAIFIKFQISGTIWLNKTKNQVNNGNCSTTMLLMFSSLKGSIIHYKLPSNFFAGPTFLITKLCPNKENDAFV